MDKLREEKLFKSLMLASLAIVVGSLFLVIAVVVWNGAPSLSLSMITQTPKGGYYLGKEGGILNAIVGSLYLAFGSMLLAIMISLPVALSLQKDYIGKTKAAYYIRLSLDVLWGTPSIVYGAFGFIVMLYLGMRASLLGGIIVLTLLQLPIMIRAMEEVVKLVPEELKEASYTLGATKLETTLGVVVKQALPGIVTAALLAFGRGIGDAASILFTAGYTDSLPRSLFDPVASLPLAVFFQLGTPFPEVQQRAYASALILLIIVLALSITSRYLSKRFMKNIIR
ncbi:phosphate ABC transporter, permease protein PstA [Candidatus Methanoperedens nitroreducens]|uniref:Phosphate transport system permease protein PstA n=1 Tax=Candidatus Methanoperedens nitratireducens TaxID=1392998 RepID=A0A062UT98_9EURY|nr:phosphate ABC transporter permease PstA [Candidatus Methanoperedens nitroreducens]KCZ70281.1 phosphate ABC transporter, permease protein PstA [Candidatus Methanoperedens nitroreducens]MDJ1423121.1 phosphate ABC transporter permease PstA [Candidatus Methanoperedens sp.]